MKIEQNGVLSGISVQRNQQAAGQPDGATQEKVQEQSAKFGGDRVELSARQREVSDLKQAAAGLPDVRSDKVAALRASINAGTYRVDSTKVAEKMLKQTGGEG